MKILLVDDERFAIDGLISLLNWKRFNGELIRTASNGSEALSIINSTKPDVIISDIKMPIMDGLELAKEISKLSKDIHIILLSAHSEFSYAQKAIQYGVKDYILKPIDRNKLILLENLLVELNQKKIDKKASYLNTFDTSLKSNITKALSKVDEEYFETFFLSNDFLTSIESVDTCNVTGIQLINYLYSYLSEIKIVNTLSNSSLKNDINKFYDLKNVLEKKEYIINRYSDTLRILSYQRRNNSESIANMAIKYIDNNFTSSDFNISFLAEELNVSISYLSTLFKQSTGINLISYITNKRLNKSKELLSNLHYSISEVSKASGYEDAKYFAKIFKKKTNMTPSEYRNLCIQNSTYNNEV